MITVTNFTISRTIQVSDYSPRKVELSGQIVVQKDIEKELVDIIRVVDVAAAMPHFSAPAPQKPVQQLQQPQKPVQQPQQPQQLVQPPQQQTLPPAQVTNPQQPGHSAGAPMQQPSPPVAGIPQVAGFDPETASDDLKLWVTQGNADAAALANTLATRVNDASQWTESERAQFQTISEKVNECPF